MIVIGAFVGLGAGCGGSLTGNDGSGGTGGGAAGHGAGGGGATGTGGGGAGGSTDGGPSCGDLMDLYTQAMKQAQSCDVGATGQCQQMASGSLSPCFVNCMTYVNDATVLNAIKQTWEAEGCNNVKVLCPAIACIQPTNSMCVAADGGGGVCSSGGLTAN
jgi:hypothetical protein